MPRTQDVLKHSSHEKEEDKISQDMGGVGMAELEGDQPPDLSGKQGVLR